MNRRQVVLKFHFILYFQFCFVQSPVTRQIKEKALYFLGSCIFSFRDITIFAAFIPLFVQIPNPYQKQQNTVYPYRIIQDNSDLPENAFSFNFSKHSYALTVQNSSP